MDGELGTACMLDMAGGRRSFPRLPEHIIATRRGPTRRILFNRKKEKKKQRTSSRDGRVEEGPRLDNGGAASGQSGDSGDSLAALIGKHGSVSCVGLHQQIGDGKNVQRLGTRRRASWRFVWVLD